MPKLACKQCEKYNREKFHSQWKIKKRKTMRNKSFFLSKILLLWKVFGKYAVAHVFAAEIRKRET